MFSSPWAGSPLRAGRLRFNLPPEEKEEEEEEEPTEKGTFLLLFCCPCLFDIFFYLQLYFSSFRTSNMELTWRPSTSLPPFSIF